jgi:hypothetical protein
MSKSGKSLSSKQATQIKERGDKLAELKTIYAERFADIPEKNRPKAKSYNAAALLSAAAGKKAGVTEAQQLEQIIAKDRAAYNARKAGTTVKKPRKAALAVVPEESSAVNASAANASANARANAAVANSALLAVAPKKHRTAKLKVKMDASALRAEAARVEAELIEQARAAREALLAQAKEAEERSAARRLAAEAAKAARAMAAAAKKSATAMESQAKAAVSASLADLEVQAAANLKNAMGANAPAGMVKGLAAMRKNGRNITAKNFANICSHCTGKDHKPRKVRSNKGTKKGPKKANASASVASANNSK